MHIRFVLLLTVLVTLTANDAKAQFLGDLFFDSPSVIVGSGNSVTLFVAVFTGSDTFGSADFALEYNSDQFEVMDISFPAEFKGVFEQSEDAGVSRVRVLAANGRSLQAPRGVTRIATIVGKVLSPPGETIEIASTSRHVFLATREEITNDALGAEIVVSPSRDVSKWHSELDTSSLKNRVIVARQGDSIYDRARKLRRTGSAVQLVHPDGTFFDVVLIEDEK